MKFSELNVNDLRVIRGIHNVVEERGADWRYPNGKVDGTVPANATHDPKYCDYVGGGCYNLLADEKTGACIIGSIAVDQGLPTQRQSNYAVDADRWGVSKAVETAMGAAQTTQDQGFVWGQSLKAFNESLSRQIEDYDAELLNFLAK